MGGQAGRPLAQTCIRPAANAGRTVVSCELKVPASSLRSPPFFALDAPLRCPEVKRYPSTLELTNTQIERARSVSCISCLSGVGEQLSESQVEELRQAFDEYVLDSQDTLRSSNLGMVMQSLGEDLTDEELQDMIEEVSFSDDNAHITFADFVDFMTRKTRETGTQANEDMFDAFRIFDPEGKGFITAEEFRRTYHAMGDHFSEDDIREMFSDADTHGDGRIDFKDFVQMLKK